MVQLPNRHYKNRSLTWNKFHFKNLPSPTKAKNSLNPVKNIFEKKLSKDITLRNFCTKLSADWSIYRHGNYDSYSVRCSPKSGQVPQKPKKLYNPKITFYIEASLDDIA